MINERPKCQKTGRLWYSLIFLNFLLVNICMANDVNNNYKVKTNSDGGYCLEIDFAKMNVFSADGFFQRIKDKYEIKLIGKGEDWSYRGQKGFYYSKNEIVSNHTYWDIGYAWVDEERTCIYLNLYWVSAPDSLIPADVNGTYKIKER